MSKRPADSLAVALLLVASTVLTQAAAAPAGHSHPVGVNRWLPKKASPRIQELPVRRNAIGQVVSSPTPAAGTGGPAAVRMPNAIIGAPAHPPVLVAPVVAPKPYPTVPPIVTSRGRIEGSSLARPAVVTSAVGGPAKSAGGIDGTTLRRKR